MVGIDTLILPQEMQCYLLTNYCGSQTSKSA